MRQCENFAYVMLGMSLMSVAMTILYVEIQNPRNKRISSTKGDPRVEEENARNTIRDLDTGLLIKFLEERLQNERIGKSVKEENAQVSDERIGNTIKGEDAHVSDEEGNTIQEEDALSTIKDVDTGALLKYLEEKLKKIESSGRLRKISTLRDCNDKNLKTEPCADTNCQPTRPLLPRLSRENIENIRKPVRQVGLAKMNSILKLFDIKSERKNVVIVTGATSNHFHETEAAIVELEAHVFPGLRNYSYIYYDLGLTQEQREKIMRYPKAELRSVPFSDLPPRSRSVKCYTWKPLVLFSHMQYADYLIWMDASVRFHADLEPYLRTVDDTGMLIHQDQRAFAQQTAKTMFDYYGDSACQFSEYYEMESGMMIFKNEPFTRHLVFEPWVACALDTECMCPIGLKTKGCQGERAYSKCHRYDQSSIAYNLILALREDVKTVTFSDFRHWIRRDKNTDFFDTKYPASNETTKSSD